MPFELPRVPEDVAIIAYAAGIIDGEGCISSSIRRREDGRLANVVRVHVTMCTARVPRWLQDNFGGSLHRYPAYGRQGTSRRERDVWALSGRRAAPFLEAILPYLKEKQDQARIALEIISMLGRWGGNLRRTPLDEEQKRIALSDQLKRMKTEGMNPLRIQ